MNVKFNMKTVNKVYQPYMFDYDKRINVYYGGAGSGKSHFVVQKSLMKAMKYSGRRTLVIRKVQTTIRDSIFRMYIDMLKQWSMLSECRVNKSNLEIELPNGSIFLFKGYDDPEKIKSIAGIDDIIVEEATELTLDDFTQLDLRLRSNNPFNQIHLMFNPIGKNNWVYKRWFEEDYEVKDNEFILHTTYLDNRFLPIEYIEALEGHKENNYTYYQIYALGKFATLDKLVYENVSVDTFDYIELLQNNKSMLALFGLDFGYTADPTAFIAILLDEKNKQIYIYDEMYERKMLNGDIANKLIAKGYRKEKIIADSASPKDIDELKNLGVSKMTGVKKGPGSILNGINYIKQYEIIVHSSCVNAIEEFNNYSWKKKDGEYINEAVDDNNHLMDALRYAVSEVNGHSTKVKLMDIRQLGFR